MTSILFWVVVALLALFAFIGIAVVLFVGYFVFIKKADEINIYVNRNGAERGGE